jgi:transcriptional regulator with XRE-family HTH domain
MKQTTFGRKLCKLRKAAGLSQAELAKRAGCNPVSISQYERGVNEPRDERATTLIELIGGGSHPPEELKAAAPKKRGRPRKDPATVAKPKRRVKRPPFEPPDHPNCRSQVEPVEPEKKPKRGPGGDTRSSDVHTPVRLGSVSRDWVEQQTDSFVHSRGMTLVDGQVVVVTMRRADLIELAATVLGACGTRVGE